MQQSNLFSTSQEVYCQTHNKKASFLDSNLGIELGKRVKCKKCDGLVNPILIEKGIEEYLNKQTAYKSQLDKIIEESNRKLLPLKVTLLNFRTDISNQIANAINLINKVEVEIKNDNQDFMIDMSMQASCSILQTIAKSLGQCNPIINKTDIYHKEVIKSLSDIYKSIKKSADIIKDRLKMFADVPIYFQKQQVLQIQVCKALAFSSDQSLLATGSGNDIQLWRISSENFVKQQLLKGYGIIMSLCFPKSTNNFFASSSQDNLLIIWEQKKQCEYQRLKSLILDQFARSIIFVSKDEEILTTSQEFIFVWKKNNQCEWLQSYSLEDHSNSVYQLTSNNQGSAFASCSFDKIIIVWEKDKLNKWIKSRKIKTEISVQTLSFIDEKVIAYQENNKKTVKFCNFQANDAKQVQKLKIGEYPLQPEAEFSPMIFNSALEVLILKHNQIVFILRRRKDDKFYIEYQFKGYNFGTLSNDGQLLVLINNNIKEMHVFKNIQTNITPDEWQQTIKKIKELESLNNQNCKICFNQLQYTKCIQQDYFISNDIEK